MASQASGWIVLGNLYHEEETSQLRAEWIKVEAHLVEQHCSDDSTRSPFVGSSSIAKTETKKCRKRGSLEGYAGTKKLIGMVSQIPP